MGDARDLERVRKAAGRAARGGRGARRRERRWERALGVDRLRRKLVRPARGAVLEVACGTGQNFRWYRDVERLVAGDVSPRALRRARDEAERLGLAVELHELDAARLPFANATFDTVVSSLSTCMFPDPELAVREMRRVCKPTGRILLLEHGRSTDLRLGFAQDLLADAHFRACRCRQNQDPVSVVRGGGARILEHRRHLLGIYHLFELEPTGRRLREIAPGVFRYR